MNRYHLAFKAMWMISKAIEHLVNFSRNGDKKDYEDFKENCLFGIYIVKLMEEENKTSHGHLNDLKRIHNLYDSFESSYKKIEEGIRLEYHIPLASETLLDIYALMGEVITEEMLLEGRWQEYGALTNNDKIDYIVEITEGKVTLKEAEEFMTGAA